MHLDPNTESHFALEQIDPRATLLVLTDVARVEAGFTRGIDLREHWESSQIQRVSSSFPQNKFPIGWFVVTCPDARRMFIKFTSTRFQLLDAGEQPQTLEQTEREDNMTTETTSTTAPTVHKAPPKKVKAVKPSKAAAKKAAAKSAKPKPPAGNYKWLMHRLKAQALGAFGTDGNRHTLREGMKDLESYRKVREFLNRSGVKIESFEAFLDKFFDASINR